MLLLGKLFTLKIVFIIKLYSFVKLLYKSEFSYLVYFLQPLKVLPSSA